MPLSQTPIRASTAGMHLRCCAGFADGIIIESPGSMIEWLQQLLPGRTIASHISLEGIMRDMGAKSVLMSCLHDTLPVCDASTAAFFVQAGTALLTHLLSNMPSLSALCIAQVTSMGAYGKWTWGTMVYGLSPQRELHSTPTMFYAHLSKTQVILPGKGQNVLRCST